MASSFSSFLVPCDDGRGCRFRSLVRLCMLLRLSPPFGTCLAYEPYVKNAPHCARPINPGNRAQVPALLADLLRTRFPSARAGRLLEQLSTRAVCGVTGWHQNEAGEVYSEWRDSLWSEYLLVNGLHPRLWNEAPHQLTMRTWEITLDVIQSNQQYDSEEEEEEDDDFDDSESDSEEDFATPDTTTSDFDQNPLDLDIPTRSQSLQTSDWYSERPESSVNSQTSSRATFNVYHDPEVQSIGSEPRDVVQASNPAPASNVNALRPLDQNIPVARAGDRTPPSWSHEASDPTPSSSAVSYSAESRRAASSNDIHQLGVDTSHTSSDDESPAISNDVESANTPDGTEGGSEDQGGSEDEEAEGDGPPSGNISEEQTQAGADGLQDPASSEYVEDTDADSAQHDAEEDPVAVETRGMSNDEESQSAATISESEVPTTGDGDGDNFAADLLALGDGIFEDADTSEVASVSTDHTTTTTTTTAIQLAPIAPPPRRDFRLYPQAPTPLSQLKQLLNTMTQTVSPRGRDAGFIYAFARPSLPGFLKIGYVKGGNAAVPLRRPYPDPVDGRLAQWQADCGHQIVEVFRARVACRAAERLESLVHLTLREYRRVKDPPCGPCERRRRRRRRRNGGRRGGGRHDEWFEVGEQVARRAVDLWALFAARLPYDRFGRLVDFWSEKVDGERRRVGSGDTVMSWLETMPQMLDELTKWEFGNIVGPLRAMTL